MTDEEAVDQPRAGTPRWVKVAGAVVAVLVLLVVVKAVAGGHGPGRHLGGDNPSSNGGQTAPTHTPPAGGHSP
jgi:hypothetical protein